MAVSRKKARSFTKKRKKCPIIIGGGACRAKGTEILGKSTIDGDGHFHRGERNRELIIKKTENDLRPWRGEKCPRKRRTVIQDQAPNNWKYGREVSVLKTIVSSWEKTAFMGKKRWQGRLGGKKGDRQEGYWERESRTGARLRKTERKEGLSRREEGVVDEEKVVEQVTRGQRESSVQGLGVGETELRGKNRLSSSRGLIQGERAYDHDYEKGVPVKGREAAVRERGTKGRKTKTCKEFSEEKSLCGATERGMGRRAIARGATVCRGKRKEGGLVHSKGGRRLALQ